MRATSPDGQSFSVTRRWLPWRRKGKDLDPGFDVPGIPDADDLLGIILLVILVVLAVPLIALAIIATLELLLLLALLPFYVLARMFFGVTWEVEVHLRQGFKRPLVHTEKVQGWAASGHRITEVATAIRDGGLESMVTRSAYRGGHE